MDQVMPAKNIVQETERLKIREFSAGDSPFIKELLNTPGWLKYIGDRKIKTLSDAENYLQKGPLTSYKTNRFGLWLVLLKPHDVPIGMCGLLKREALDHPDIGFAFLPEHSRQGYGTESAKAILELAKERYQISTLYAVTNPDNEISQRLLMNLGFAFQKIVYEKDSGDSLKLFMKSPI